jgi:hypothetical protein
VGVHADAVGDVVGEEGPGEEAARDDAPGIAVGEGLLAHAATRTATATIRAMREPRRTSTTAV